MNDNRRGHVNFTVHKLLVFWILKLTHQLTSLNFFLSFDSFPSQFLSHFWNKRYINRFCWQNVLRFYLYLNKTFSLKQENEAKERRFCCIFCFSWPVCNTFFLSYPSTSVWICEEYSYVNKVYCSKIELTSCPFSFLKFFDSLIESESAFILRLKISFLCQVQPTFCILEKELSYCLLLKSREKNKKT